MTNSGDIVLSYYDSLIRTADVELLKGPHWLNDVIIGFYFEYLDQTFNKDGKKRLLFVSPELTQLLKMSDPSQYNMFLEPLGISDANFIFFVLNNNDSKHSAGGSHWSLVVCNKEEKSCYHFDSSKGYNSGIASDFAKNIMFSLFNEPKNKLIEPSCPQQENGYDCGIYALCFADVISEYAMTSSKFDKCNYDQVKHLVKTKRKHILNLINELKSLSSNT